MPDSAVQLPLEFKIYNNQSLFSDHYLDNILQRDAAWRQAVTEGTKFLAWLRDKYTQEKDQLPDYKESQLEENWFKDIFEHLGHVWEVQAAIPGIKGSTKKPDYAFFLDEDARKKAVTLQNSTDYAQAAIGVGEVKQWGVNLSKKTGKQPTFEDQNPMFQIDTYLNLTGLDWGILSNGRSWRLVNRSSSRTLETYFEIDLLAALHAPDETKAKAVAAYFWLFFNQTSFCPDAKGQIFLDEAISQSRAYAVALEADLRDNAYRSLEQLIIGFFEGDQTLDKDDPADRDLVYQNSLYLLYRLLFLFYGESRGLLPMHNPRYKEDYSMQQLAKHIDNNRNGIESMPVTGRRHWHRLGELFRLISGIDAQLNADLNVPRYNGGLFDPEQHPFLESHFVGDKALAKAIDYLAVRRIMKAGGLPEFQTVDYSTLDVRQLGSIYEGLLEYKVVVAEEEMVTVSKSGVETWVPTTQKGKAKTIGNQRYPGDLYLTTDKGERKATGSYYTPDYIVEYIVDNTLGPLVQEAREQVKAQVRETGTLDDEERKRQSAVLFVANILQLNVLDPAMGSGHFLVEATNYLARALATDEYVQVDLETTDSYDAIAETDLLYWKRRVVEACIYGVDKNPMAVELAKLSLWLKTASADKPLSFLDHHLRHGDSLIGAWLKDLQAAPGRQTKTKVDDGQAVLFDEDAFTVDAGLAVKGVVGIEELPTLDIEDVHTKEKTWRHIQGTYIVRWQRLADLWVSNYFGNRYTAEEYRALVARIEGKDSLMSDVQMEQFLSHPAITDNDYFHWELAFPEVFFDEYGRSLNHAAGFDVVIGNPPYVRQEQLSPLKPFFSSHFDAVYTGTADLFVYFFKQALNFLREDGLTSYISSNSWLRANYATNLRAYLRQNTTFEKIIDLGDNRVFADAPDVYPAIHIVAKSAPSETYFAKATVFERGQIMEDFTSQVQDKQVTVSIVDQPDEGWRLESDKKRELARKVLATGLPLTEMVKEEINRGVLTGFNDAFIISQEQRDELIREDPSCASIIRPIVSGADVRPWFVENKSEWLICSWRGTDIDQFSSVKKWLSSFREQLEPRPKDWKGAKWPGRKNGPYLWHEIQDNIAYRDQFNEVKILYPELSKFPRFAMVDAGIVANKTAFMIPEKNWFLLGILMSRVTWFAIQNLCQPLGERAGMMRYTLSGQFINQLPIPDISEKEKQLVEQQAEKITDLGRRRYQLHEQIRHRILTDLGTPEGKLNNALTAWWNLDFSTFRTQIKNVFKRDIPLKERREWELFLADARQQHQQLTSQIIILETELNQHVYTLFHLTPEEIQIIETSTKYPYGEV